MVRRPGVRDASGELPMTTWFEIPNATRQPGPYAIESPDAVPVGVQALRMVSDATLDVIQDPTTIFVASLHRETAPGSGAFEDEPRAGFSWRGEVIPPRFEGEVQRTDIGFEFFRPGHDDELNALQGRKVELRVSLTNRTRIGLLAQTNP